MLRRKIRFGDLGGTSPIALPFERGTPIDRYYIETFLAAHAAAVRGHVLEVGGDGYCRHFGRSRVAHCDILHVRDAAGATIVGDLSQPGVLPLAAFDCAIVTQTLHYVYDLHVAMKQLHASLRPGGTLLATVPGISPVGPGEWEDTWFWSFTPQSLRRLSEAAFGAANAAVECYGNVFAATAFLHGVALEEVDKARLDTADRHYPVIVAVAARR